MESSTGLCVAFECIHGCSSHSGRSGHGWTSFSCKICTCAVLTNNGSLSSKFKIEHGVLQGSVLSPVLFLLVMDPLLKAWRKTTWVPLYIGAFAHADDIKTITSNLSTLKQQVNYVKKFCSDNVLTLNVKFYLFPQPSLLCPPLCVSWTTNTNPCESVKCLGYWCLFSTKSIQEGIAKARCTFLLLVP